MKQPTVDEIVGHGSTTEYDRTLERIKKRSLWMRGAFISLHGLAIGINWGNVPCCAWIALSYYFFWTKEDWMIEAFEAITERGKDSLRHGEMLKKIIGTKNRRLYE